MTAPIALPDHPVASVLMVCMGNLCRSPTAEAVLRHQLDQAGLTGRVRLDSAGTHAAQVGKAPDARAQAHAANRGYDLGALRVRRVAESDFETFDLIVTMDDANLRALREAAAAHHHHKLVPLMAFAPGHATTVPDPYYGGPAGFERVLDLVELACKGLVEYLRGQQGGPGKPEAPTGIAYN